MIRGSHISMSAAMLAAACSPYVYEKEVSAFSKGLQQVVVARGAAMAELEASRTESERAHWQRQKANDLEITACKAPNPLTPEREKVEECRVVDPTPDARRTAIAQKHADLVANASDDNAAFQALSRYAAALASITNAKDDEALSAAITDAGAAFGSAEASFGGGAVAEPLATLFGAAARAQLNARRLSALRDAVSQAQEPIEVNAEAAAKNLAKIIAITVDEKRLELRDTVVASQSVGKTHGAQIARSMELAAEIRALVAIKPRALGSSLAKAHAKLATALQDEALQLGPLTATLNEFKAAYTALDAALDDAGAKL